MENMDPLAPLKIVASSYGIPPEMTEALVTKIFGFGVDVGNVIASTAAASQAAEVASLMAAAKTATEIGEPQIAGALLNQVRALLSTGPEADDPSDLPS